MDIRPVKHTDEDEWVRLRMALWPDADPDEFREEFPAYLEGGDRRLHCLVVERPDGRLGGLMEISLRLQAEGCLGSPVTYIENWYVDEDLRRQGLARRMLESAARWARHRGCAEIASSCVVHNTTAIQVHEALGFEEVDRLVHFVYELPAEG
jgi:aminoglycoside 6'-N-acetyltransferase I